MKKISLLLALVFCVILFTQFMLPTNPSKEISDKMIAYVFSSQAKYSQDTTVKYTGILPSYGGQEGKKVTTNYSQKLCGENPVFIYYFLYSSFDKKAFDWSWHDCKYDAEMENNFKKISGGKKSIKSKFKTKSGTEFRFYDSQALLSAFNSIYVKPTESFNGLSLQKIYDATLKDYCRDMGNVFVKVMSQKAVFEKDATNYLSKAKTDPKFEGQSLGDATTVKIFGKNFETQYSRDFVSPYQCLKKYHPTRIVGIMLRRQCDGSLPALLTCYKTMIKDYDPTFYSEIKDKF